MENDLNQGQNEIVQSGMRSVAQTHDELIQVAAQNDLENDEQTNAILTLVSHGINTTSANHTRLVEFLLTMTKFYNKIKAEEIKELNKLEILANSIYESFQKTLADTKTNMSRMKPHMEPLISDLTVLKPGYEQGETETEGNNQNAASSDIEGS
jgi:hypothetical protein